MRDHFAFPYFFRAAVAIGGTAVALATGLPALSTVGIAAEAAKSTVEATDKLAADKLGKTPNVHAFAKHLLCGQPSAADLAAAKERGIAVVISLRGEQEIDWDEALAAKKLGLEFHRVAFREPDSLTDAVFDDLRKIMVDAEEHDRPVLLHCGAANRVGAIWLVHRVLDQGISLEQADKEATEVGLKTEAYRVRAKDYIKRHQKASGAK